MSPSGFKKTLGARNAMDWVKVARAVAAVALTASLGAQSPAWAKASLEGPQAVVALQALPAEGQQVHRLIHAGGPFAHPEKDGQVFGNRERRLPVKARGYYREYTVPTPRSRDRGARRLVCGGLQPTAPEVCYYTQDHYASFRRVAQ